MTVNSIPASGFPTANVQSDVVNLKQKLERLFGSQADSAFNKDGSVNPGSLSKLLNGPASSADESADNSSSFDLSGITVDTTKFLHQFTKNFGAKAAADITNSDGSIDFTKVKSYIDTKINSQNGDVSGLISALNSANSTSDADSNQLFGNSSSNDPLLSFQA